MKSADKPVLCVVSSHPMKGASGVPTGTMRTVDHY